MDLIFINKNIENPSMVMCTRLCVPYLGLDCVYIILYVEIVLYFRPTFCKKNEKKILCKTYYKNMLKNPKFDVKKIQFNKIIFKNGCLMRVEKNESFQEKKSLFKKYRFLIKKVGTKKKGLMLYHPFIKTI